MKLSIIIPVYNAREFLHNAVESVCSDPGEDWELILVNDGSQDGSGQLCEQYAASDRRVRAIHQENRGPGGARNTGMENARGEYLFFVDSDDALNPGALDRIRRALEEYGPDILTFDYYSDDYFLPSSYPPVILHSIICVRTSRLILFSKVYYIVFYKNTQLPFREDLVKLPSYNLFK